MQNSMWVKKRNTQKDTNYTEEDRKETLKY